MKWYPADWRAEPRLRMSSLAARGLWADLISYMHEAEPYGHLIVDVPVTTVADIAALVSRPLEEVQAAFDELALRKVFSRTDAGVIYSRRMVRDAEKVEADRKNGRKGGNPKLLGEGVNRPVGREDKAQRLDARGQNPESTPSQPPGLDAPRARSYPRAELDRIEGALRSAAGLENDPAIGLQNLAPILGLLDAGYDLDADIVPTIRAKRNGKKAGSWSYFVTAIQESRGRRASAASVPPAQPKSSAPSSDEERWARMWQAWSTSKFWHMAWGPRPDAAGCQIPQRLIEQWSSTTH